MADCLLRNFSPVRHHEGGPGTTRGFPVDKPITTEADIRDARPGDDLHHWIFVVKGNDAVQKPQTMHPTRGSQKRIWAIYKSDSPGESPDSQFLVYAIEHLLSENANHPHGD
jgi:hypothetical protein